MLRNIVNFIFFQFGWLLTVLSAATGIFWTGVIFTSVWVFIHLRYLSSHPAMEIKLIIIAALTGYVTDSVLVLTKTMSFVYPSVYLWPSTIWMLMLWINLSLTINASMKWINGRYVASSILGLIGGALSYYAGHRLGALSIASIPDGILIIGIVWSVVMPLLIYLNGKVKQSCYSSDWVHDQ